MTARTNETARLTTSRLLYDFLYPELGREDLQHLAEELLSRQDLPQIFEESSTERQRVFTKTLNRVYEDVTTDNKRLLDLLTNFFNILNQLPDSISLSTGLVKEGPYPEAPGGLMDVWRGRNQGACVAIKPFRTHSVRNLNGIKKTLSTRVPLWRKFRHRNITPFHGITTQLFPLALVYGWEEGGNIMRYIKVHPGASRLTLLLGVAEGLQYLHSLKIPHGNLTGTNVLVGADGHARLTDYGFAPLNVNPDLTGPLSRSRFFAPEIANDVLMESESADIFAFGMLACEVFTGRLPFGERSDARVVELILSDRRPELPENAKEIGLTPEVWGLLQRCWHRDPTSRPSINEVVKSLKSLLGRNRRPRKEPGGPSRLVTVPGVEGSRTHPESLHQRTRTSEPQMRSADRPARGGFVHNIRGDSPESQRTLLLPGTRWQEHHRGPGKMKKLFASLSCGLMISE